ncbi:MAG: AAA family ATPase [Bacteroidia bacterium]|nr:AAA family ATPase [Bacteroidia bacterium]
MFFGKDKDDKKTDKKEFKPYKFKDIKVYSSDEWMAESTKKYRTVFDRMETDYIRVEFSFYNKLFDEEEWEGTVTLKAYSLDGDNRKELCNLETKRPVKTDENIVYVRDGWGNATPGAFWFRGDYIWEAWINGELIGSRKFFVEDIGKVTRDSNLYFEIESLKMYEGGDSENTNVSKKYLKEFSKKDSRYIWTELNLKVTTPSDFNCEIFFNFFDDAGQPKGQDQRMQFVKKDSTGKIITFHAGWGRSTPGIWTDDKYTMEIVFMDTLIAAVPFKMHPDTATEGEVTILHSIEETLSTDGGTAKKKTAETQEPANLEEVMKELDELVGLEEIKAEIRKNINYLHFVKLRKEKGFEDSGNLALHSVFTGNPGTGKTTVVRLLGKIYKQMGLLSKGHVKEVDRADLVAQYIGQTAPKVKKAIDEARGGILFVDEAYALSRAGSDSNDFGPEVIEILLKEMSDGKGDIAIMFAGYPKEMGGFLEMNPGLRSRINYHYNFPDYLPEELMKICESSAKKNNVTLTADALNQLTEYITDAYRSRDESFGNARFANSIITEAKMNMGIRLMNHPDIKNLSNEILSTIEADDIHKVFEGRTRKKLKLSVDEKLLKEALDELNGMIGMRNIKEEVNELVKLVRFYQETGRDVLGKFSLHSVFTGNPGTGKTTVARIIGKIYKGLGVLERGHVVECDREGLVAGYVGQTATKTAEKVNQSMGGILFIDEAYALVDQRGDSHGFGGEAIATILKRMEDHRGQFGVIVAGYPGNMKEFIETNPGLKSRFDKTYHFEDYSAEELMEICLMLLKKEKLHPTPEALAHLQKYFTHLHAGRDKHFGNARTVRNAVGECIKNQHLRMSGIPSAQRTREMLEILTLEDVREFEAPEVRSQGSSLGFKYGKG